MVKAKKYFYVLRPVLACRWILDKGSSPPMLFADLMEAELPCELFPQVRQLLDLKMNSSEVDLVPRYDKYDKINDYLDASILEIKNILAEMEDNKLSDWGQLNQIFLDELW